MNRDSPLASSGGAPPSVALAAPPLCAEACARWGGLFWNVVFCVTGVGGVLIAQTLDYNGFGEARSGATSGAMFVGLLICGTPHLFTKPRPGELRWHWSFAMIAVLNILGELAGQICIASVGSGVYIVVYSSLTVFIVAIRWAFLGMRPSGLVLLSIVVITGGLSLTVVDSVGSIPAADSTLGFVSGFLSPAIYAVYYVLCEWVFARGGRCPGRCRRCRRTFACCGAGCGEGDGDGSSRNTEVSGGQAAPSFVSPTSLGAFEGYFCTMFFIVPYAIFYDSWHWTALVTEPMDAAGAEPTYVGAVFLALVLMNGVHILALLYLFKHTNAIVAGVNKAVQAALIFAASSLFYCGADATQCLTPYKGASIAVVILGVLFYAWASWRDKKAKTLQGALGGNRDRDRNALSSRAGRRRGGGGGGGGSYQPVGFTQPVGWGYENENAAGFIAAAAENAENQSEHVDGSVGAGGGGGGEGYGGRGRDSADEMSSIDGTSGSDAGRSSGSSC